MSDRAPEEGGATAVADAADVLAALPAELTERFEQEGWLLTRTYNEEIGRPSLSRSAPRTVTRSSATAARTPSTSPGSPTAPAHRAAPLRRRTAPGHRRAVLVQPDRLPQRVDTGPGGARVPGGRVRRGRAAVQHPLRRSARIPEGVVQRLNETYRSTPGASPGRPAT
ncbi:TauD/TfdA family dioxygenase [Streptomyces tricolor]|nr:TauD/TfdA family dioxygenase [Streptomyces tricolor]